jgi:hypothetical protein
LGVRVHVEICKRVSGLTIVGFVAARATLDPVFEARREATLGLGRLFRVFGGISGGLGGGRRHLPRGWASERLKGGQSRELKWRACKRGPRGKR